MRHIPAPKRRKIGEILIKNGMITEECLKEILIEQKIRNIPVGQLLIEKKIISNEELVRILGEQMGIPHIWLRKGLIDPAVVHLISKEKAVSHKVIPMFLVHKRLTIATCTPHAYYVFDEIHKITGCEVQPVICREEDITRAIEQFYEKEIHIDDVIASFDEAEISLVSGIAEKKISEIAKMAEGSPVINMVNMILLKAIRESASDIHIEPQGKTMRVRARIDGILYELMTQKIDFHPAVISRLKVMGGLDISERRMPQDGRIQVDVDGRIIDLRFSSMPGIFGEKVVLRILDRSKALLDINGLGFDDKVLGEFKKNLKNSHGLILVCGPTGSGKTTTLYSAISMLNTTERNIITIEDPVEYQLENINQNQVNSGIGLSFAKFLKHALRQDPDVIMVGEIRDKETAEIAVQASLTGHLVLSTLHTDDSTSTISRLLDMGVESYLLTSSLLCTMAQRLVRTLCPHCKIDYFPPKSVVKELGLDENRQHRLFRGKGCDACFDSGFKGRTSIHEILTMDESLQELILENSTVTQIRSYLKKRNFLSLKKAGYRKVINQETTIEEVQRVISLEI